MSDEINQSLVKLFQNTQNQSMDDFVDSFKQLTRLKEKNRFGLSIIEMILTELDDDRIGDLVDQGIILHPKECLQLNIDLKPLVEDLLQNDNILVADNMIQSIQLSQIDQTRKYHFLMFLIPFMQREQISGKELPSFFDFFQNYKTLQEEQAQ